MTMPRWKWLRPTDEEPMDRLRVDFYLTRGDYAGYLCATSIPTGATLGNGPLVEAVRDYLKAAPVLEPTEYWAERGYSEAEAAERWKWAEEQVAAFYGRTRQ
jgi:hypothetical protein